MARDLLARADHAGLASDVVSDEFVTSTGLSVDDDLLPAELGYESNSYSEARQTIVSRQLQKAWTHIQRRQSRHLPARRPLHSCQQDVSPCWDWEVSL